MIPQISVTDLKAKLDSGEDLLLVDVREKDEYAIARIDGATLLPLSTFVSDWEANLGDYRDKQVIVHCKMGGRSQKACEFLAGQGFTNVSNVTGGITAWSDQVDPNVPKY